MATDLNKTILIGRLTRDPELRITQNGTSVCSFSIANNRTYVTGGEKKDQVSFFNCVAWAKTGEAINEYCRRGQRIGIEGRLQQRSWDDQNGNKRSAVEVVVETFQFLTPKGEGKPPEVAGVGAEVDSAPEADYSNNPFDDSDIPF